MAENSTGTRSAARYRFGTFEADAATGELRRQGLRVKLNAQPFQVLLMLLARPGQLLTREEISRELWPDGTFVDYEHGVNSAVNRIREALGDTAASPRFVETLARRGYRFVAPVERIDGRITPGEYFSPAAAESATSASIQQKSAPAEAETKPRIQILATPEDLPKTPYRVVQTLFVLFQLMYLAFYIGALANLAEIRRSPVAAATRARRLPRPHPYGCHPHSCARLHSLCRALPRAGIPRKIPQALAGSSGLRCVMVALALFAPAPHQLRTGARLHHAARLFALCAALARPHGWGQRKSRKIPTRLLIARRSRPVPIACIFQKSMCTRTVVTYTGPRSRL